MATFILARAFFCFCSKVYIFQYKHLLRTNYMPGTVLVLVIRQKRRKKNHNKIPTLMGLMF